MLARIAFHQQYLVLEFRGHHEQQAQAEPHCSEKQTELGVIQMS
jgi:hypothetical protein